ncbi:MAG: peptidoglycan DD-metalloendopeptidase family protein [Deltaproteobacteria bacterium]|nr:peptidoglycan DD-metalloendopeptidase family protein [Deltaproteobacteria bacterium]
MKKKAVFSLAKCLILSGLIINLGILLRFTHADAAQASDRNQRQIEKIERKLSSEKQKLKKIDSQEKDLLGQLASLEQEVAKKRGAVDEVSKKLHRAEANVGVLRRKLSTLKQSSQDIEIKVSSKLVKLYKHTRKGYIRTLLEVKDIAQFWRRVKYLRAVMEEDRMALIRSANEAHDHQDEISRTEAKLTEIRNISSEKKARLMLLKEELKKKVLRLMKIHNEKEFYETAVVELQAAAESLKQTLINIEKKDNNDIDRSFHFKDFRGKLAYPFKGRVIGYKKIPGSARPGAYKGIVIEGVPGSDVKVIFSGVVAFSGKLKGYGELVIINHGSRFFTVSAHLSKRNKIEGDVVEEGDVLGQIGGKRTSGGARLYFEIRRGGKSLNPQEWLKAK